MLALVTATKNSAETLPYALSSLSALGDQALSIFVDGGSSDATLDLLAGYTAKNSDAIQVQQQGTGLYQAINQGVEMAIGCSQVTHIGLLHSDDRLILPAYREFVEFACQSEADICYSDIRFHDPRGRTVRFWKAGGYSTFKLKTGWMPPHTSMIVRKDVYQEMGLYRLDFGTSADYEWVVRVLKDERSTLRYFPATTMSMQTGGASDQGLGSRLRANKMDGKVWSGQSILAAWTIRILKPLRKIGQFWPVRGR